MSVSVKQEDDSLTPDHASDDESKEAMDKRVQDFLDSLELELRPHPPPQPSPPNEVNHDNTLHTIPMHPDRLGLLNSVLEDSDMKDFLSTDALNSNGKCTECPVQLPLHGREKQSPKRYVLRSHSALIHSEETTTYTAEEELGHGSISPDVRSMSPAEQGNAQTPESNKDAGPTFLPPTPKLNVTLKQEQNYFPQEELASTSEQEQETIPLEEDKTVSNQKVVLKEQQNPLPEQQHGLQISLSRAQIKAACKERKKAIKMQKRASGQEQPQKPGLRQPQIEKNIPCLLEGCARKFVSMGARLSHLSASNGCKGKQNYDADTLRRVLQYYNVGGVAVPTQSAMPQRPKRKLAVDVDLDDHITEREGLSIQKRTKTEATMLSSVRLSITCGLPSCTSVFHSLDDLREHLVKDDCPGVPMTSTEYRTLLRDLESEIAKQLLHCPVNSCRRGFASKLELKVHLGSAACSTRAVLCDGNTNNSSAFNCPLKGCNSKKLLRNYDELERHLIEGACTARKVVGNDLMDCFRSGISGHVGSERQKPIVCPFSACRRMYADSKSIYGHLENWSCKHSRKLKKTDERASLMEVLACSVSNQQAITSQEVLMDCEVMDLLSAREVWKIASNASCGPEPVAADLLRSINEGIGNVNTEAAE